MQVCGVLLPIAQLNCEWRPVCGCVCVSVHFEHVMNMCMCVCWLGWMRDPGCAEMPYGKVCGSVVHQVIADISSFVNLIADLHCL